MNKPVSAKCYSRVLNDSEQISPKMRRSRKLSWKKGGVDCEVSRRERDIPEYIRTDHDSASAEPNQHPKAKNQRKNSLEKSFTSTFGNALRIYFGPHPSLFFSRHREQTRTRPALSERSKSPSHSTV